MEVMPAGVICISQADLLQVARRKSTRAENLLLFYHLFYSHSFTQIFIGQLVLDIWYRRADRKIRIDGRTGGWVKNH